MTKIYFLQKSTETKIQKAEQQVKVNLQTEPGELTQSLCSLPNGNVCKDPLQGNLRIHSFFSTRFLCLAIFCKGQQDGSAGRGNCIEA